MPTAAERSRKTRTKKVPLNTIQQGGHKDLSAVLRQMEQDFKELMNEMVGKCK